MFSSWKWVWENYEKLKQLRQSTGKKRSSVSSQQNNHLLAKYFIKCFNWIVNHVFYPVFTTIWVNYSVFITWLEMCWVPWIMVARKPLRASNPKHEYTQSGPNNCTKYVRWWSRWKLWVWLPSPVYKGVITRLEIVDISPYKTI